MKNQKTKINDRQNNLFFCLISCLIVFSLIIPSSVQALELPSFEHPYDYAAHYSFNTAGVYSISWVGRKVGIPKNYALIISLSTMAAASLYKEYVLDSAPDSADLLCDGLGMLTGAILVIRF